jgi:hypothetical protein
MRREKEEVRQMISCELNPMSSAYFGDAGFFDDEDGYYP